MYGKRRRGILRRFRAVGVFFFLGVLLTGCSAVAGALDREPHPFDESLPPADVAGMHLPDAFEGSLILDPGWVTRPQEADGVFVGALQRSDALEYIAVDSDGTVLWAAERPLICSGFTVTEDAEGRALAVLVDSTSTQDMFAAVTASAYELSSGELVWGPVEVPGPYLGPGLVFAAPAEAAMGEAGPRTALDPTTGEASAAEGRLDGTRIIGEYRGIVLLADATGLIARDAHDGSELWRIDGGALGGDPSVISARIDAKDALGGGLAQFQVGDTGDALIDLTDGTVLDYPIRDAAVDNATEARVILDATSVTAFDDHNNVLWSQGVSDRTRIAGSGDGLVYLDDVESTKAHDIFTGDIASKYDGLVAVPSRVGDDGTGVIAVGEDTFLVTAQSGSSGR